MLKLKSQLTCSNCSRIFNDPILLPCDDSICREHLSERDISKANRIKCKKCNAEFGVKNNEFISNETLKKLVESHSYLSEEEINLKKVLEQSIREFFQFYDEFVPLREKMDSDVFDYFQEMRFQVDEHREELKSKIDEIALAMIDRIKTCEEVQLKSLKEKFFENSSFDESKSTEELEETFRQPNLLIETIREMQQKQDESLKDIQLKLNEINQVEDDLIATNEFQPNLSLFNQNSTSLFGSIRLYGYSNMNPFKSQILEGERQSIELIKLCKFSSTEKWSLLYRGTRDGFGSNDFHSKCDGHYNTLTVVKAKQSKFIFGGFTSNNWKHPARGSEWKPDPYAFIFSLTNKDDKPIKLKSNPYFPQNAIYCDSEYGPCFGGGHDLCIANNANTTMDSYSRLGSDYIHPHYAAESNEVETFLAGSINFQLVEIEVYLKE
jgi:hypothetical protein